ncbi:hypothetical protein K440DRAFT_640171 [Wilcoxina mikolae CBS 423.85]|nr:hypothetical protein K440DRAFT_640171 [Wilcoxina mikolae CBS 423.85]
MAYSMQFASAFIHGYVALELVTFVTGLHLRFKRFIATVRDPDLEFLPGTTEGDSLIASISVDNLEASVSVFVLLNMRIYVPGNIVYVSAKVVALPSQCLVLDTTIHQTSAEGAVQPETPRKKGWWRAPPATPSAKPVTSTATPSAPLPSQNVSICLRHGRPALLLLLLPVLRLPVFSIWMMGRLPVHR